MTKLALDKVLKAIPALTDRERGQVLARLRALSALDDRDIDASPERADGWLLDGLRAELLARGIPAKIPYKRLKATQAYKRFAGQAEDLGPWLSGLVPNASRTDKLALGRLLAEALADYMLKKKTDLSLPLMLDHFNWAPAAFEASFPGYAASAQVCILLHRKAAS